MCLGTIRRYLRPKTPNSVIGFKVVEQVKRPTASGDKFVFRPVYAEYPTVWELRKIYRAKYEDVNTWVSRKSGCEVKRYGLYKDFISAAKLGRITFGGIKLLSKVRPTLQASSGATYECGFHFFTTLREARNFLAHYYSCKHPYTIVKCRFYGIITMSGLQWNRDCGVARKMKILKTVKRSGDSE